VRCSDHLDASNHRSSGKVSGSAVRNGDVNPRPSAHPSTIRPSTIANVSGTAVVHRGPPICEISPKKIGSEPACRRPAIPPNPSTGAR